ncbi:hypothetical protein SEA_COLUCCI_33 [Arthrobacter phage Colucci]|uniref:Uncharacterized protein n=1 Tax=Arthrobacter phage Colucci TaxID=2015834 RepID=A0A286N2U7_9CAUD|nr:hypothetical protein FDI27_gp033 [Arthrobacter phage Colucci]ASX98704.1 hypothetical protein SEA_COLUCCI_33 [Arthrobacter phage Colucci]
MGQLKSPCSVPGHYFIVTTQGTLNKCFYCNRKAQRFNFGTYQIGGAVLERQTIDRNA